MHVMVTGGAGYIGCQLVPALIKAGHRVTVVDKLVFGAEGLEGCAEDVTLHAIDIRDVAESNLQGVDAVVHLAALSNDPTAEYRPAANRSINLEATLRLAQLAKTARVSRFVFASSCSVYYTEGVDDAPRDEACELQPKAPYSWSKFEAERGLLKLGDAEFIPVILRKGTVFCSSARMRYDLVVNTFTCDAYAKGCLRVHAGGRMWRPLLHIDDAVEAYLRVLEADGSIVNGKVYNVANGNYRVIDIAHDVRRAIRKLTGTNVKIDTQPVGVSRSYRVTFDRIGEDLDFRLSKTIASAVDSMWPELENGIDPTDARYYNIRWIELLVEMESRLAAMGGKVL